jgi:hypothetical protein
MPLILAVIVSSGGCTALFVLFYNQYMGWRRDYLLCQYMCCLRARYQEKRGGVVPPSWEIPIGRRARSYTHSRLAAAQLSLLPSLKRTLVV